MQNKAKYLNKKYNVVTLKLMLEYNTGKKHRNKSDKNIINNQLISNSIPFT